MLCIEGFGNPLVQRENLTRNHTESATFMSIAFGVLLALIVVGFAPLVITPLYDSRTTHLVQLASLMFPIYSLAVVPEALLTRKLDLRTISIVETVGSLAASVVSVGLAVFGLDGAAVVVGAIAGGAITALMLLMSIGMPRPRWHAKEAREIARYGIFASGAGLAYLGVGNVDNVIVGARLGAAQLGLYYRAFALGVSNQLKVGAILLRVAFPAYSRATSDEEMRMMRDRMTRLNSTIIAPLLILLAVVAPTLVPFLFGPRWQGAVVPTQILSFAGIANCVKSCAHPYLFAAGHPKAVLNLNLVTLVIYLVAILIAAPHGLNAICAAVVIANVLAMMASYAVMRRLTALPLRRLWDDSAPALISSLLMALVSVELISIVSSRLPAPGTLLVVCGIGAGVYALGLRVAFKTTLDDVILVVRRVLGSRTHPTARRHIDPAPVSITAVPAPVTQD